LLHNWRVANPMKRILSWEAAQLLQKLPAVYGPRGSLCCPQQPATDPYFEQKESILPWTVTSIFLLYCHKHLCIPTYLFHSGLPSKFCTCFFSSPVHATCSARLIFFLLHHANNVYHRLVQAVLRSWRKFTKRNSVMGNTISYTHIIITGDKFANDQKWNQCYVWEGTRKRREHVRLCYTIAEVVTPVSVERLDHTLGDRGFAVPFSSGTRDLSLLHSGQIDSEVQAASYPVGTRGFYPKMKRPEREADHSPPYSSEIKNGGTIPPLPHTPSCSRYWQIKHSHCFALIHIHVRSYYATQHTNKIVKIV
jgi:hypothetical protein